MHITLLIIITYIACCFRLGTVPWKFFQLNARYFSKELGIFSKLAIDKLIPERWRLGQVSDTPDYQPPRYPVFLKPEWGQNAHGIHRADNFNELQALREKLISQEQPQKYIVQEAAPGAREFEIFSIDINGDSGEHNVLTVTEAVNQTESYPINSKYNNNTRYVDVTQQFNADKKAVLAGFLNQIGTFAISRMSVRADDHQQLLAGNFHVIEVNLFLPMPINLLDSSYSWSTRLKFIGQSMMSLARATKAMKKPIERPPAIFTRMMLYGHKKRFSSNTQKFDPRRTLS